MGPVQVIIICIIEISVQLIHAIIEVPPTTPKCVPIMVLVVLSIYNSAVNLMHVIQHITNNALIVIGHAQLNHFRTF